MNESDEVRPEAGTERMTEDVGEGRDVEATPVDEPGRGQIATGGGPEAHGSGGEGERDETDRSEPCDEAEPREAAEEAGGEPPRQDSLAAAAYEAVQREAAGDRAAIEGKDADLDPPPSPLPESEVDSDAAAEPGSDPQDEPGPRPGPEPEDRKRDPEADGSTTHVTHNEFMRDHNQVSYSHHEHRYGVVETVRFEQLSVSRFGHLDDVFVEPPGFPDTQALLRGRVFVVHGSESSGRWTCALYLAMRLRNALGEGAERPPRLYLQPRSEHSLLETLQTESLPSHGVILMPDYFQRRLRRHDLSSSTLGVIVERLRRQDLTLVLTGSVSVEDLPAEAVVTVETRASNEFLQRMLVRHLRYAVKFQGLGLPGDAEAIVERCWDPLRPHLRYPYQISRFCEGLHRVDRARLTGDDLDGVLVEVAVEVGVANDHVARSWFAKLTADEQLYAIYVYLFGTADPEWVESLYRRQARHFREQGLTDYPDPRQRGSADLRQRTGVVERGRGLEFEDRTCRDEVARQVTSRRHLLWEVLESLVDHPPFGEWAPPWRRRALGVALARLGAHDPMRLMALLRVVADDSSWRRAVVPGYALQELVELDPLRNLDLAEFQLHVWVDARSHRQMWTAAAASWRVYYAFAGGEIRSEELDWKVRSFRLLRKLAKKLSHFRVDAKLLAGGGSVAERRRRAWHHNFLATADAMARILWIDAEAAAPEVGRWLDDEHPALPGMARAVVRSVFVLFSRTWRRPCAAELRALLDLLQPLLAHTGDLSVDGRIVFLTLRAWLPEEDLAALVQEALLRVATTSSDEVRRRLRALLTTLWLDPRPAGMGELVDELIDGGGAKVRKEMTAYWLDGSEAVAARIGQVVLARCRAVEGALPPRPGRQRALAVVDPRLVVGDEGTCASSGAVWSLLSLLESRYELRLQWLGETATTDFLVAAGTPRHLLPGFPRNRLLVPGVDAAAGEWGAPFELFVLADGPPGDLEDLEDPAALATLRGLVYLGPAGAGREPGPLDFPWPPSGDRLEAVRVELEARWATDLAVAGAERWRRLTRRIVPATLPAVVAEGYRRLVRLAEEVEPSLAAATTVTPAEPAAAPPLADLPPAAADGETDGETDEKPEWEPPPRRDEPVAEAVRTTLALAAHDLPACLQLLAAWLVPDDDRAEVVGVPRAGGRRVATAAALALLRLYRGLPVDGEGGEPAPTLLFNVLADPLARQGDDAVAAVVAFVEHWLGEPAWACHLAGDARHGRGRLERWARAHLVDRPALAGRIHHRLAEVRPAADVGQHWAALAALQGRLDALRALRPNAPPAAGEDGGSRVLVLVDCGGADDERRRARCRLAIALFQAVARHAPHAPLLQRLGERQPCWSDVENLPEAGWLSAGDLRLPPLLGPTLQSRESRPDDLAAVLVVTARPPVDLHDWAGSPWWPRLRLYGDGMPPREPRFSILPEPLPFPILPLVETSVEVEAQRVVGGLGQPAVRALPAAPPAVLLEPAIQGV